MSLICVCCYDTVDNKRSDYTRRTFESLLNTVNFKKHRLGIFDNASCEETQVHIRKLQRDWENKNLPKENIIIFHNDINIGTARGQNALWAFRKENENVVKLDNDVEFHTWNWPDIMDEILERDSSLLIIGAKRKDLLEHPNQEHEWYKSTLEMLPHINGRRDIVIEVVHHVIGTAQMYSAKHLDKFGYLWQNSHYSLDDSYAAHRAKALGLRCAFAPEIDIDHIDEGGTPYIDEKRREAGIQMQDYQRIVDGIYSGKINPYFDGVNYETWSEY